MANVLSLRFVVVGFLFILMTASAVFAQKPGDERYGPVIRGYLGYLKNEQDVVDDRVSRHEVNASYYRRNSNRIKALRQMAIRLADETQNDYLPELEAVAADEFGLLFERRPRYETMRIGEVYNTTFRYLGLVRAGETFYIFARLDPYEQADLREKLNSNKSSNPTATQLGSGAKVTVRARRVSMP